MMTMVWALSHRDFLAVIGLLWLLYQGARLGMWVGCKLNHRLKFGRWNCTSWCARRYFHG